MLISINTKKTTKNRNLLLYTLSFAAFLVFFQTFMVAPIIPKLSKVFSVTPIIIGNIVPAFLIPYGISTLFYGPISDKFGRKPVLYFCLIGFAIVTGLTSFAPSYPALLGLRFLDGVFAGGTVPIALALITDLFQYNERGRAIGWLFGSMAGGMAFGATFGALLESVISWRFLFLTVAVLILIMLLLFYRYSSFLPSKDNTKVSKSITKEALLGYGSLLKSLRGSRTYSYVFLNGLIHSGLYTWLGYLFSTQYHLGEVGIGLSLLGYGIPGFIFGPLIGKWADRWGRKYLIPVGLLIASMAAFFLYLPFPIVIAPLIVSYLSLGYDMTQPLLAGIVSDLSPKKGLAIGLMAFFLFLGFGIGSLVFSLVMQKVGLRNAFLCFSGFAFLLSLFALKLYKSEGKPKNKR